MDGMYLEVPLPWPSCWLDMQHAPRRTSAATFSDARTGRRDQSEPGSLPSQRLEIFFASFWCRQIASFAVQSREHAISHPAISQPRPPCFQVCVRVEHPHWA